MNGRALVIGGGGYIGAHLVRSLQAGGRQVTVLDDQSTGKREVVPAGVRFVLGDVGTARAYPPCSMKRSRGRCSTWRRIARLLSRWPNRCAATAPTWRRAEC